MLLNYINNLSYSQILIFENQNYKHVIKFWINIDIKKNIKFTRIK